MRIMWQDAAGKAIQRARESFVPPQDSSVKIAKVRSHSSRQRCINDLKTTLVPKDIGKAFARISSDKVYDQYGELTEKQVGHALARNSDTQKVWKAIYFQDEM